MSSSLNNVNQRRRSRQMIQEVVDVAEKEIHEETFIQFPKGPEEENVYNSKGRVGEGDCSGDHVKSINGNSSLYSAKNMEEIRRKSLRQPSITLFNGDHKTLERRRSEIFTEQKEIKKEYGLVYRVDDHIDSVDSETIEHGDSTNNNNNNDHFLESKQQETEFSAVHASAPATTETEIERERETETRKESFDITQSTIPSMVEANASFFFRNLTLASLQETADLYARNKDAYDLIAAQCLLYVVSALECIRTAKSYIRKPLVGVIGYGGAGKQIVQTLLEFGWPEKGIIIVTRDVGKTRELREKHHNNIWCTSKYDALKNCSILILSTLPVHLKEVMCQLNKHVDYSRKLIISTLVAMTREKLISLFGTSLIIRTFIDARNLPIVVPIDINNPVPTQKKENEKQSKDSTTERNDEVKVTPPSTGSGSSADNLAPLSSSESNNLNKNKLDPIASNPSNSSAIPPISIPKSNLNLYDFSSKHPYLAKKIGKGDSENKDEKEREEKLKWKLLTSKEQLQSQQIKIEETYLANRGEFYSLYLPSAFHQIAVNYGMIESWMHTLETFAKSQEEVECTFRFKEVKRTFFEPIHEFLSEEEQFLFSNKYVEENDDDDDNTDDEIKETEEGIDTFTEEKEKKKNKNKNVVKEAKGKEAKVLQEKEKDGREKEKHMPIIIEKSSEFQLLFHHLEQEFHPFFRHAMFRHVQKKKQLKEKVAIPKLDNSQKK